MMAWLYGGQQAMQCNAICFGLTKLACNPSLPFPNNKSQWEGPCSLGPGSISLYCVYKCLNQSHYPDESCKEAWVLDFHNSKRRQAETTHVCDRISFLSCPGHRYVCIPPDHFSSSSTRPCLAVAATVALKLIGTVNGQQTARAVVIACAETWRLELHTN